MLLFKLRNCNKFSNFNLVKNHINHYTDDHKFIARRWCASIIILSGLAPWWGGSPWGFYGTNYVIYRIIWVIYRILFLIKFIQNIMSFETWVYILVKVKCLFIMWGWCSSTEWSVKFPFVMIIDKMCVCIPLNHKMVIISHLGNI